MDRRDFLKSTAVAASLPIFGLTPPPPKYYCKNLITGTVYPDGYAHEILSKTGRLEHFFVKTNTPMRCDLDFALISHCRFEGSKEGGLLRIFGNNCRYVIESCFFTTG